MTENAPIPRQRTADELFDELLVVKAQQGDRRALDRLFQRWNQKLTRAAWRYCGGQEAASDLTQDCWVAILKGLATLRDPARFRGYAFSILHRRGADHLRKVVRTRETSRELKETEAVQGQAPAMQPEAAAIAQAFAALPPDQRFAAHLYFVEGLTLPEIAQVQSIPEGTAKSRLFHARQKLKAALNPNP